MIDTLDPAFEETTDEVPCFTAWKDEDFPEITRAHFIADLHRIAKIATDQAEHGSGYIVRTTVAGLDKTKQEVAFVFYKVPRDQSRGTRELATSRRPRSDGSTPVSSEPAPATVQAWQTQATRLFWCHSPEGVYQAHEIGHMPGCAYCEGQTSRAVTTPTPPAELGWEPGQPIPAEIP